MVKSSFPQTGTDPPSEYGQPLGLVGRATHWNRLPLVASERQARIVMGAMTLLIGMSVFALVPGQRFSPMESVVVVVVSLSTIPVAVAWWMAGKWPRNALVVSFVAYADASIVFALAAFDDYFVALPLEALLCLVAVFAAVCGSTRLLAVHLAVSMLALLAFAALAVWQGASPWLVASRTMMLCLLFAVPVVLQSYIRRLRDRAVEALLDPLTGLLNQRGLFEVLDEQDEAGPASTVASVVGVVVFDVDRFDVLGDRFDHHCGDDVLREVTRRLLEAASEGTVVARLGGDEFVCVHTGSRSTAVAAEERSRAALREPTSGPPFTASVGSAIDAIIDDQTTSSVARRLVALADAEMYRAKRRATADTQFQGAEADTPAPALSAIKQRVAALVESGGPAIAFQPVVSVASGKVVGYEALSRFPEGSGSPLTWFRDATVAGVAGELELAAIDNALAAMGHLPSNAYVSINASADTIRTANLLGRLSPHLASRSIYLELTEHHRIDDFAAVAETLEEVRAAGVRLAIDDVGAGFASLLPVVELRPDVLKTDNSLTQGIDTDDVRRAAAAAIVAFAHEIGAVVLMEGVETEAEHRVAVEIGADFAQGFLHGRPLPAPEALTVP